MNHTLPEALALAKAVCQQAAGTDGVTKIMIPAFVFLHDVAQVVASQPGFYTGAQDCHTENSGAYTGEVSAAMLKSVGCSYVLVGHSERRQYFNETSPQLRRKLEQALAHGLRPIYCVGETLRERQQGIYRQVIRQQLEDVLSELTVSELQRIVLAYEPVWAIGTGETATSAQAQEVHAYTRTVLGDLVGEAVASAMPILYGGSCNARNAPELFACPDVDGGLIGGASLKADEFCKIIASF